MDGRKKGRKQKGPKDKGMKEDMNEGKGQEDRLAERKEERNEGKKK